jgi:hypothetical protein
LWVVVAAAPIVLVLFYVEKVLPGVPAALGGPQPRCVHIDLAAQEVTSLTLTPLLPGKEEEIAKILISPPTVVRTRQLDLLFSGPEFVMVRVSGGVYSIAKDAIRAMTTCR